MKNDKFHIYLDDDEYRQVVQCLISLKNALIEQGRSKVRRLFCKRKGIRA